MIYDYKKENSKKKIRVGLILGVLLVLIAIALIISSLIYLDIVQLNEIGNYSSIYITNIFYKAIFAGISFVIIFIAVAVSNIFIKRNIKSYLAENNLPQKKLPNFTLAAVIALIGAFITRNLFYQNAINFFNWSPFGKVDPIFKADIGYYVFQRPFYITILDFMLTLWFFIIVYTIVYYMSVLFLTFNTVSVNDLKIKVVLRHNLINIALFFLIKAIGFKFQAEGILYSAFNNLKGAGYIDVNIWLNYYRVAPFLIALIVIAAFIFVQKGRLKRAAIAIAIFPIFWLFVSIASIAVEQIAVKPNEINMERQYLKNNMKNTREAYGVDKVKNIQFSGMQDLSADIINKNSETRSNIRVVDYSATLESNKQLQSNTNFYSFYDGDIINYTINGKEIPVLLTPREIDKHNLPSQSYVNTMFKYTHGYGAVINPINKLTPQGQVDYILNDITLRSVDPALKINEPRIYYGELTHDHVIVNAANNLKEIDYDGNAEYSYTGKGGIKLGLINKTLFSLKYGDFNMLVSGFVSPESKLLLNRQVIERAQLPVPFLTIDKDPYMIITKDGRLSWVADAYTTTDEYPYSQDSENINYIRNSVKVVIDAYDGSVKYYVIDKNDPIIRTYMRAYPNVFLDEPLPADVALHSRYPETLFKIQTEMLRRYHLNPDEDQNVNVFYSKQDYWDIAKYSESIEQGSAKNADLNEKADIQPYYNMIMLPKGVGSKEELILMRPFTPSQKDNMVSWLAVRNSSENYGELLLYNFPKNTNIFGPYQADVKISQIDKISKDISLWNQSGSSVFKGNLLVIPIESSVLYVEPIYIKASGNSTIPEVREIVVGYQKGEEFKYGIGTDLDSALNDLFAGAINTPTANQPQAGPAQNTDKEKEKIINDIRSKYDDIKKQLDELGKLLDNYSK